MKVRNKKLFNTFWTTSYKYITKTYNNKTGTATMILMTTTMKPQNTVRSVQGNIWGQNYTSQQQPGGTVWVPGHVTHFSIRPPARPAANTCSSVHATSKMEAMIMVTPFPSSSEMQGCSTALNFWSSAYCRNPEKWIAIKYPQPRKSLQHALCACVSLTVVWFQFAQATKCSILQRFFYFCMHHVIS